jgi:hypothetical protein
VPPFPLHRAVCPYYKTFLIYNNCGVYLSLLQYSEFLDSCHTSHTFIFPERFHGDTVIFFFCLMPIWISHLYLNIFLDIWLEQTTIWVPMVNFPSMGIGAAPWPSLCVVFCNLLQHISFFKLIIESWYSRVCCQLYDSRGINLWAEG